MKTLSLIFMALFASSVFASDVISFKSTASGDITVNLKTGEAILNGIKMRATEVEAPAGAKLKLLITPSEETPSHLSMEYELVMYEGTDMHIDGYTTVHRLGFGRPIGPTLSFDGKTQPKSKCESSVRKRLVPGVDTY